MALPLLLQADLVASRSLSRAPFQRAQPMAPPCRDCRVPDLEQRSGALEITRRSDTSIEHIRSGKLRALAVTTATRLDALPDIPHVAAGSREVGNKSRADRIGDLHEYDWNGVSYALQFNQSLAAPVSSSARMRVVTSLQRSRL